MTQILQVKDKNSTLESSTSFINPPGTKLDSGLKLGLTNYKFDQASPVFLHPQNNPVEIKYGYEQDSSRFQIFWKPPGRRPR